MTSVVAEVSLHCMICYEEFNTHDRAPVVLPCGHTYICEVCARRLKKCMECRRPLFWTPPVQQRNPTGLSLNPVRSPQTFRPYTPSRGRFPPAPQTPPHPSYGSLTPSQAPAQAPPKEEPLPLPRNIVLMEMIKAAEMQAKMIEKERERTSAKSNVAKGSEGDEEKLIEATLAGMTALAGPCGTYAVREPLGLAVLPFDPNLRHDKRKLGISGEEKKTEESKEPFTIEDGQMVQVVASEDGVYKLSREVGYIMASVNQLVKVGGPLENSCRLEGMLDSVTEKRIQLQRQMDEIDLLVNGLLNQIKAEQDKPEEHPVISARKEPVEMVPDENDVVESPRTPSTPPKQAKPPNLFFPTGTTEAGLDYPRTPEYRPTFENSPGAQSCPMLHLGGHDVDPRLQQPFMDEEGSAGLPRYRVSNDDADIGLAGGLLGFGCGTGLFGERLLEVGPSRSRLQGVNSMLPSFDDDDDGRSFVTSRTTDTARRRGPSGYRPTRTGSFDGVSVNFRTGMSGHGGLTQAKNKASPMARSRQVRMMSDHRGVVQTRHASN